MEIDVIICHRLEFLRYCPCKAFHLCSLRVSRKFAVEIFVIGQSHTAVTGLKCRSVHDFDNDDCSCYFFNFEFLGQFDRCLDPDIFSGMNTCRDQHGLSCTVSVQDSRRKFDLAVCKFQLSVPLLTWLHCYIFEVKRISLSSCQEKDWRSAVIDDLFFCPDFFPHLFIAENIKESCFLHSFDIPLRAFQTT